MRFRHGLAAAALAMALMPVLAAQSLADEREMACETVGTWLDPADGTVVPANEAIRMLAEKRIVLLGESHTRAEHHRWQLHSLAGLHAHRARLTVGFEMFPRSVQSALDAWVAGERSEEDFLGESRWREVWGYDQDHYLPLFHFARQNRLPMVALNVDRELVRQVGSDGWDAVPEEAREGLTDPAPVSDSYRRSLAGVYAEKLRHGVRGGEAQESEANKEPEVPDLETILAEPGFKRFVQAQSTWDRAMAEGLFAASRSNPEALVVGVMGSGHVEFGYGVPNQLKALGEEDVAILIPIEVGDACKSLDPEFADLVYVVAPSEAAPPAIAAPKPRLGVLIEQTEAGVRIMEVVSGSVAEATGLAVGDIITEAAGFPVEQIAELIAVVQRQAPGTWLPLALTRDGEASEMIAKFPQTFE